MRVHPKSQTMCDSIKNYFHSYCDVSNIHGVHYLAAKRSKTERFVWAFLLTISISCCIFMIYKIWQKYEKSPIVISFGTEDVSVYEVPFPAITICPQAKCANARFNYSDIFYKIKNQETVTEEDFKKFSYLHMLCDEANSLELSSNTTVDDDFFTFLDEVKPNITINCMFFQQPCNDIMVPIITEFGICYSFNILRKEDFFRDDVVFLHESEDVSTSDFNMDTGYDKTDLVVYPLRAHMSGVDNSLFITISSSNSELETDAVCNSYMEGYNILVHSPLEIPQSITHYLTNICDNKFAMVHIQPEVITTSEEVKTFHPDKRQCYLSHERPLRFFKFYTQSNCFMECLANLTIKICDCVPYFLPRTKNIEICGVSKSDCISNATNDILVDEIKSRMQKQNTQCDCRPSCNDWMYKSKSSITDVNIQRYLKSLSGKKYASRDPVDNFTFSMISVSFQSNQFMAIERKELFGVFDLISNFGGLLGLFLGFSLISLMEIVYFFTWRVFFNKRLFGNWSGN